MVRTLSTTFILLLFLSPMFLLVSAQDCTDANCKTCSNPDICDVCQSNYVLVNQTCALCSSVINNCNVCNDTILPVQCVSCSNDYYSNNDFSACDNCSNLIGNCAQCSYQAPFELVQCSQCTGDFYVSDDKYSCVEPFSTTVIIVVVIVVVLVGLGVGGFFLRRYLKKKNLQSPLMQEQEEYQKAV